MGSFIDLSGKKFGKLIVIRRHKKITVKRTFWECICSCGNGAIVRGDQLKSGHTSSCGCYRLEQLLPVVTKHGRARDNYSDRTYRTWAGMHGRCNDLNNPVYGGRGIKVCARWKEFKNFLLDMGDAPPGKSLDRINNNGDYSPSNCRWATRVQQASNTSRTKLISYRNKRMTVYELARRHNICPCVLRWRIRKGWKMKDCLTRPVRHKRKHRKETNHERRD